MIDINSNRIAKLEKLDVPNFSPTPILGWNAWYAYGRYNCEDYMVAAVGNLSNKGFLEAGYNHVGIDGSWSYGEDYNGVPIQKNYTGSISNGIGIWGSHDMAWLADYIHSHGYKAGMYYGPNLASAGSPFYDGTYGTVKGSLGRENAVAKAFSEWGYDYLKYDKFSLVKGYNDITEYAPMAKSLYAQEHPLMLCMCQYGEMDAHKWAGKISSMYRIGRDDNSLWDTEASWNGVNAMKSYEKALALQEYNKPNAFIDMDIHNFASTSLSFIQHRTYFALMCMMQSPILISAKVEMLSDNMVETLQNKYALSINQDIKVNPCKRVYQKDGHEILIKELLDGVAVMYFNRGDTSPWTINTASFNYLVSNKCFGKTDTIDVWNKDSLGEFSKGYELTINQYDCVLLIIK